MKYLTLILVWLFILTACESKPKVITAESASQEQTNEPAMEESASKLHKVVVEEILPTEKYSYLRVKENDEDFWIAIPKTDIEKGGTYYYRGGLKKTDFKSVEYDRVFETVYLVSGVSKDPGMNGMSSGNPHQNINNTTPVGADIKVGPPPGGIKLAELINNKKKYDGQVVKVQGRVVKLNNMIMNRNWIHIQDASLKDEKIDLTVTTDENVALGDIVVFEGKIALNKDFGAGYKYEIIMEEAHIIR
jgi:hypothetical protein